MTSIQARVIARDYAPRPLHNATVPERPPVYVPPGAQTRRERDRERAGTHKRGYDHYWRQGSAFFLTMHPLCECDEHQGRDPTVPATVVDHIIPIRERPDLRMDPNNWRAMAKACHDAHTARTRDRSSS